MIDVFYVLAKLNQGRLCVLIVNGLGIKTEFFSIQTTQAGYDKIHFTKGL